MSKITDPHAAQSVPRHLMPTPDEIRLQLNQILNSPTFQGSRRSSQFLGYVCEKSIAHNLGALKERTIAVEVFGRSPESVLGEDTIVRVGAREVRKRLAQYYDSPQGAASKVRIDLPSGSYAAEFRYIEGKAEEPSASPAPVFSLASVAEQRNPWNRHRTLVIVGLFMVAAALTTLTFVRWAGSNPNSDAFQQFWQPVFKSPEPFLLAVGHPIVYLPPLSAVRKSEQRLPRLLFPSQRPLQLMPGEFDASEMAPALNQFVGFGDMVAGTEVASMLARKSKAVRVRLANSIHFADLKQAQTLLIGAVTNQWTMELGQAWRYQFVLEPDLRTAIADTSSKPGEAPRRWGFSAKSDGSASKDYFLLSRVTNSPVGGLLIVAAGVKQFGTEAAGLLLTEPDRLGALLRKLPPGWETKNLQLVLQSEIIGNTPAEPQLVAWHVW